jgi:3-oxoacyl-[acyl-carrier-protein] synthase III
VIRATPTPRTGDRLRRATRECLLAIDAVEALLEEGGLTRADLAGGGTALVYVTAGAYGASNRAFVEGGGGALHFPYTAPSAVPAEVAIEFGLHGAYAVLIGGATATIDALTHAATLLARGACEQALVLAVETFAECEDLYARARGLLGRPLVEAAAAVLLAPSVPPVVGGRRSETRGGLGGKSLTPPTSHGETLACGPLLALAVARRAAVRSEVVLAGRWRAREASLKVAVAPTVAS